jgi:hypothetical protein
MFKTECNRFLDNITALRSTAVNKAVTDALENEHKPYESEVIAVRDALIVEERTKTAELIKALQADLERKVNDYTEDANKSIAMHRERVVESATEKAKAEYDNFILSVSKLVDNSKII